MGNRRMIRSLAVALLLIATPAVLAQPIQVEDYTLPNGLRVVLNQDRSAPLVAVNVWYHVGSKNEKPGRTGFAHLFEHMLFSGSQNVGPNEHFRHVQSVGGVLNGSTNLDRTNYYQTMPSNYLPLALWLEADRMGFFLPTLSQERLDVQKNVVQEERRQRYDNVPYGTWIESLLRLAYPADHPYSWPTIGSMADLRAAELEDVREFFRTWYSPNNATLVIVGDFDPGEARRLVDRYFGTIPRGPEVRRPQLTLAPLGGERRDTIEWSVQLPRVYRMYRIAPFGEPDWLAANLLGSILAGDKASRLDRSLVIDKQIAQDAVTYAWPSEATGMFVLWSTAKPGVATDRIEREIDAEIQRIAVSGVTSAELERAKAQTEAGIARQLAEFASRADLLNTMTTFFGDPTRVNQLIPSYRAVTAQDIQRVAARYLVPDNRVTVTFVPKSPAAAPAAGGAK
jgi:zinc protease